MSSNVETIKKNLRDLEDEIKKEYRAEIIGLFGSYTRQEQKEGSDIDILVRFLEGATLLDFVGLANFLEDKLKIKVDIVSERAVRPELRKQILDEVVTV